MAVFLPMAAAVLVSTVAWAPIRPRSRRNNGGVSIMVTAAGRGRRPNADGPRKMSQEDTQHGKGTSRRGGRPQSETHWLCAAGYQCKCFTHSAHRHPPTPPAPPPSVCFSVGKKGKYLLWEDLNWWAGKDKHTLIWAGWTGMCVSLSS